MSAHLPSPPSPTMPLSSRQRGSLGMGRLASSPEDDDEHDDPVARSALEIRREKNRIKQRNLRLRRANQMADLEQNVTALRARSHELEDRLTALETHEASLQQWVRDLENVLSANGQQDHVDALRRMWSRTAGNPPHHPLTPPSEHPHSPPGPAHPHAHGHSHSHSHSHATQRDPLATLASAASSASASSYQSRSASARKWVTVDDEENNNARKRRRDDDYSASSATTGATQAGSGSPNNGGRLPSPSRMRIDQLVIHSGQQAQVDQQQQQQQQPWAAWGHHAAALEHGHGGSHSSFPAGAYEQKPRTHAATHHSSHSHSSHSSHGSHSSGHHHHHAQPQHDSRTPSPTERSPPTTSGRPAWASPVQSFEIRL